MTNSNREQEVNRKSLGTLLCWVNEVGKGLLLNWVAPYSTLQLRHQKNTVKNALKN